MNHRPLGLISPFPCRFDLQDVLQPTLFLQAFKNFIPGAGGVFAHLALSFPGGSAAGPVENAFRTSGDRADSSSFTEDAFSAGPAIFLKPADVPVDSDKDGVQSGEDRFFRVSVSQELDAGATSHGEEGVIVSCDFIQFGIKIGIALTFNRKAVRPDRHALLI